MHPLAPECPIPSRLRTWTDAADVLLEGIREFRSPDGAAYSPPGPRPSDNGPEVDGFEGFARSLLLAALRSVHASEERRAHIVEGYAEGLAHGPRAGGSWPRLAGLTQPMVEAAAVAVSLLIQPALLARLDERETAALATYLHGIRGTARPAGNWMWFRVMIETLLERIDGSGDQEVVDDHLDAILSLRRRDGMWSDGGGARYDYYSSWAFSFYGALWTVVDGERRPDVAAMLRSQIEQQRATLLALIDDLGRPVLQGRSLIYRAAVAAGLWAPRIVADATTRPLDVESAAVATRMIERVMRSGAVRDGILSLGWEREFLPIVQPYSGPASPLWISKAFLGLLIDPADPIWSGASSGADVDERVTISDPGWLLQRDRGLVRLHNHGVWRADAERDPHSARYLDDPLYARLAYSSATAPAISGELLAGPASDLPPDNAVLLRDADGASRIRRDVRNLVLSPAAAMSEWTPAAREREWQPVRSMTVPLGRFEMRLHWLNLDRPTVVALTGYAVSGDELTTRIAPGGWAVATAKDVTSAIRPVGNGAVDIVGCGPGAFGARSAVPRVHVRLDPGRQVVATVLALSTPTADLPESGFDVRVDVHGVRVTGPGTTIEVLIP